MAWRHIRMSNKLSVHHVGGRNGSQQFPPAKAFETDIVNVLYDADPDCVDHAREQNATRHVEIHVLPYCIADSSRTISFNLNRDPFTSTYCKMNPGIAQSYYYYGGHVSHRQNHDYVYGEVATPIKKLELSAVSLDDLFQNGKSTAPSPDFLSLDTDGSEYGILQGAGKTLESVLAVYSEFEFQHVFKDGHMFGDLAHFLHDKGYFFVGIYESVRYSPYCAATASSSSAALCFCAQSITWSAPVPHQQRCARSYASSHSLPFFTRKWNTRLNVCAAPKIIRRTQ